MPLVQCKRGKAMQGKVRIVVLDGHTVNPGDTSWEAIAALGDLTVYDRTCAGDIVARAADADVVITNKTPLTAGTLDRLPNLRCIGILATGYDVVDVACAGRKGIPVMNVVQYGTDAVAQHAMALLLELCRRPALHDESIRAGKWSSCPEFCYWLTPQTELSGLTFGIIGFGAIGRRTGALAYAFGMNVMAASARMSGEEARQKARQAPDPGYPVHYADLDELLASSDVISLHCPLTEKTRHLINASTLARMKKGALLLNVARGPLLQEEDVAEALFSGQLGGLGADVLSEEPARPDNILLTTPNTVITPHIAWASLKARQNIITILAGNIASWMQGEPRSLVNADWLKA